MTNKTRNKLKERLEHTQKWAENFLEVEKHREISKKALKQLNKDKPILGWIFTIIYLPSRIWDVIYTIIWWNNRVHKLIMFNIMSPFSYKISTIFSCCLNPFF